MSRSAFHGHFMWRGLSYDLRVDIVSTRIQFTSYFLGQNPATYEYTQWVHAGRYEPPSGGVRLQDSAACVDLKPGWVRS